jgi:hypothetical protein
MLLPAQGQPRPADGAFHLLSKAEIQTETYLGKSGMPLDYRSTLSSAELNDLVGYLRRASRSMNKKHTAAHSDDGVSDGDGDGDGGEN